MQMLHSYSFFLAPCSHSFSVLNFTLHTCSDFFLKIVLLCFFGFTDFQLLGKTFAFECIDSWIKPLFWNVSPMPVSISPGGAELVIAHWLHHDGVRRVCANFSESIQDCRRFSVALWWITVIRRATDCFRPTTLHRLPSQVIAWQR